VRLQLGKSADGQTKEGREFRATREAFRSSAPQVIPNPYTNTLGARYGGAGWTDNAGNLWPFGGEGWELSGNAQPATLDAPMNDLWVCVMVVDQCRWQLFAGYHVQYGTGIYANAQNEDQLGIYTNIGANAPYPTPLPGGRWGAATWADSSGNLWLFGGNGNSSDSTGLLNDFWEFNTSNFHGEWARTLPRKRRAAPMDPGQLANSPALALALPNAYFNSLGIPPLTAPIA